MRSSGPNDFNYDEAFEVFASIRVQICGTVLLDRRTRTGFTMLVLAQRRSMLYSIFLWGDVNMCYIVSFLIVVTWMVT